MYACSSRAIDPDSEGGSERASVQYAHEDLGLAMCLCGS